MPRVTQDRFRVIVLEAVDALPEWTREAVDNLQILFDDEPPEGESPETLGLYVGTPLPSRELDEEPDHPDRITLFAGPIEREGGATGCDIAEITARVLRHELAHHFGMNDEELWRLGAY
jgi:predicted Zn-dependent protease with MMP-like domain